MWIVLLQAADDGPLVVAIRKELAQTQPGGQRGGWVDESFDEQVVDDLAGLFALAAVDPEHLEEERVVVREGRFEPTNSM